MIRNRYNLEIESRRLGEGLDVESKVSKIFGQFNQLGMRMKFTKAWDGESYTSNLYQNNPPPKTVKSCIQYKSVYLQELEINQAARA